MYKYLLIVLLVITLPSCLKEDLTTISDLEANATWVIPFIDIEIDFTDLMKGDELINIDEDSLIHIIYRMDSVNTIEAEEILTMSISESVSKSHQLGVLEIEDIESQLAINLLQLSSNLGNNITEALEEAASLPLAYFPPLESTSAGMYDYDPFADFNTVNLSSGTLSLEFTNNFPINIEQLRLLLFNSQTMEAVSEFEFTDVDPNTTQIVELPIENDLVNSSVSMAITSFITPGSGSDPLDTLSYVSVDLEDEMLFAIQAYDLIAEEGLMVFPSLELEADSLSVALNLDDDISINKGVIQEGSLVVSYESTIKHPILLNIHIPNLETQGQAYTEQFVLNNTFGLEVEQNPTDLALYELLFGTTSDSLEVHVGFEIISNGEILEYNNEDELFVDITIENVEFSYVEGDFGQSTHLIPDGMITLNTQLFDQLDEDLFFEEPKLAIRSTSGFGIPMEMDLSLSCDKDGQLINLDATNLPIYGPNISQGNITITSVNELDIYNSNISDLINAHVQEIYYSGVVRTNQNEISELNSLYLESSVNMDIEVDMPLYMKMSQMQFVDSLGFGLGDENVDQGFQLRTFIKNDFPFDTDAMLLFRDTLLNVELDSIKIEGIQSSEIDAQGNLIAPSLFDRTYELNQDQIDAVLNSNQLVAKIDLQTRANTSSSVKIYSDYKVSVNLGMIVNIDTTD